MATTSPSSSRRQAGTRAVDPGVRAALSLATLPAAGVQVGLIGRAIGQSRTPGMHEAEGRRLGLDYRYRLLDFDALALADGDLPQVLDAAAAQGFAGLNVTHPFKQAILPWLDELAPDAASIGAVNTVVFRDGRATGHNTDCFGFAESFRREMPNADLGQVLLVGAGGAGAAVARALVDLGAGRIEIFDLDSGRAAALVARLAEQLGAGRFAVVGDLAAALGRADGLVNATPIGMAKYPGAPVPLAALRPSLWVADVIYFPAITALVAAAAAGGCRTLPGRGMAIFQAVRAFELFTGVAPDPAALSGHFDAQGPLPSA